MRVNSSDCLIIIILLENEIRYCHLDELVAGRPIIKCKDYYHDRLFEQSKSKNQNKNVKQA